MHHNSQGVGRNEFRKPTKKSMELPPTYTFALEGELAIKGVIFIGRVTGMTFNREKF